MKLMNMSNILRLFLASLTILLTSGQPMVADESAALKKLRASIEGEPNIKRNDAGAIIAISLNAPDLTNEDLALFNEFEALERLTISHAGYAGLRDKGNKKTGVDFSGVRHLKAHPSLNYFSAGGAVGAEYLEGLAELDQVTELYIQTTNSTDEDWAPIGLMEHLTYLGIRVRNDRMSQLTDDLFLQLMPLRNLERFLLSEMTFEDPATFVEFIVSRPKLEELIIRRSNLSEQALATIREAKPELAIQVRD